MRERLKVARKGGEIVPEINYLQRIIARTVLRFCGALNSKFKYQISKLWSPPMADDSIILIFTFLFFNLATRKRSIAGDGVPLGE